MVMNTANQNSCTLSREFASDRHTPYLMSYELPITTKAQVVYNSSVLSSFTESTKYIPQDQATQ